MNAASVRVAGHPFQPVGISRVARISFASFRAAGIEAKLVDLERTVPERADPALAPYLTHDLGDFNLFHLNGDEIEEALDLLGQLPAQSRNAICPMWELSTYPKEWARQLDRFDEIWAASHFIAEAIRPVVSKPVLHMPLATQAFPVNLRSRRYFGIPEASYAFLFAFDMRSYIERKNPFAVIEAFRRLVSERPFAPVCLIIKMHGFVHDGDAAAQLTSVLESVPGRVVRIDGLMSEDDVHALIYNCDAFISLHRAEGYGLGMAEAMSLGRPVIATGYSGNVDFMNPDVAFLVDYELVPVPEGAYPHWQGQHWANPDIDQAALHMKHLVDDPGSGRLVGSKAARAIQTGFSFRAAGLRYAERLFGLTK